MTNQNLVLCRYGLLLRDVTLIAVNGLFSDSPVYVVLFVPSDEFLEGKHSVCCVARPASLTFLTGRRKLADDGSVPMFSVSLAGRSELCRCCVAFLNTNTVSEKNTDLRVPSSHGCFG